MSYNNYPYYNYSRHKTPNYKSLKNRDPYPLKQQNYAKKNCEDDFNCNNSRICGIANLGNNCYLSSGLQILASCNELVKLIQNDSISGYNIVSELKNAFNTLLGDSKTYYPDSFIKCFCSNNSDFIRGSQCCSQDFIRTLIRNINDVYLSYEKDKIDKNNEYNPLKEERAQYEKFINKNKIFPESKAKSIFSGIIKSHSFGNCPKCRHKIDDYSFTYFIDQNIYLDEIDRDSNFSEVLKTNLGNYNTLTMDCPNCNREITIKEDNKIVKLPNILIFTLERYQGPTNSVRIKPDLTLEMKRYIDESLKTDETSYELFAINIRLGRSANFGHEICQVKRGDKWYEINDRYGDIISNPSHYDCSYGLFYRKKGNASANNKYYEYESSPPFKLPNNHESQINNDNISNIMSANRNRNKVEENQYIYCAFEIIASFKELIDYLDKTNKLPKISLIVKNIIKNILYKENPDLTYLKSYYFKFNDPQDFIRHLIAEMNKEFIAEKYPNGLIEKNKDYNIDYNNNNLEYTKYNEYLKRDKIFPQSEIYSIFYVMTKQKIYGKCEKCTKMNEKYKFSNQIDFIMDLPEKDCDFSKLLKNIENSGEEKIKCDFCDKKSTFSKRTTIIKLPNILIFTLNRASKIDKNKINKVKIRPNEIDLKKYIDSNVKNRNIKYKLFAIVLLQNDDAGSRYICKFTKNSELDDQNDTSYLDSSYGLFYRRA
jgi:ubiquitin C-terminal hydrolase